MQTHIAVITSSGPPSVIVTVKQETLPSIPRGMELHRIRYRGEIIEKVVPSPSAEAAYAQYITETFATFAETNIPDALVVQMIDDGTPMLIAEHMDWENGLVKPLHSGVDEHVAAQFSNRGEAVLQGLNTSIPFNIMNPRSLRFLEVSQYKLIKNIVAEQKSLIRQTMVDAYKRGLNGYKAARSMRGQLGLTHRQARAITNFEARLWDKGVHPNIIAKRVAKYTAWNHKYRADRIARTELNRAANAGELEGWRQAADNSVIDRKKTMKHWLSYIDQRTSEYCNTHDGVSVPLDEPFDEGFDHPPAHPHCYDDQTDVLTDRGWRRFAELDGTEKILSLNPETQEPEWVGIRKVINYPYAGEMIHFKSHVMDLLVTPGHRMYVGRRTDDNDRTRLRWSIETAQETFDAGERHVLRTAKWEGAEPAGVRISPRYSMPTELYCRFMGYWLSEGSVTEKGRQAKYDEIKISQQSREKKAKMLADLDELNPRPIQDGMLFRLASLGAYLRRFGHSKEKFLPKELLALSPRLLRIFLDAFLLGDGTTKTGTIKGHLALPERIYFTSSDRMMAGLVEAILKCGGSVGVNENKARTVSFTNGDYDCSRCWRIRENRKMTAIINKGRKEIVAYNGTVGCVELERNGIMLVRRNHRVAWCGNCRSTIWVEYVLKTPGAEASGAEQWMTASDSDIERLVKEGTEWERGLRGVQAESYEKWIVDDYRHMRNWMRGRPRSNIRDFNLVEHSELSEWTTGLRNAARTAPKVSNMYSFRGGALLTDDLAALKEGTVLTQSTFASSSVSKHRAVDTFLKPYLRGEMADRTPVLWKIRNRSGRFITTKQTTFAGTNYARELEVLLQPGQQYKIVGVTNSTAADMGLSGPRIDGSKRFVEIVVEEMKSAASAESLLSKGIRIPWAKGAPATSQEWAGFSTGPHAVSLSQSETERQDRFLAEEREWIVSTPQCLNCKHIHEGLRTCDAFTLAIPDAIYTNEHDHHEPFPGDSGIRFEPKG